MAANVLSDVKKEISIVQTTRREQLNCWSYALRQFLAITEEDLKNTPKTIELPEEKKLNVIVEGKLPTCFGCRQKGHIRKRYS